MGLSYYCSGQGETPISEWVEEKATSDFISSSRQGSRHSNPSKRSRRANSPKRFWSNPERTPVTTSSDYEDVALPQGDENEWETGSEASDMDIQALSESNMAPNTRRFLTEYEEDVTDGKQQPAAPPRGVSTSRSLQSQSLQSQCSHISQAILNPARASPKYSPQGSPRISPGVSPRASPTRVSPITSPVRKDSRTDSKRRLRRKGSLDANIPAPKLGVSSRSCTGASDCSGGSLFEESDAEQPPPPPPPRRSPGENRLIQAPAPPLPPRDSCKKRLDGTSPPPPTPPRTHGTRTVELAPNTIVPLTPEVLQPSRKERDELTGRPRLPPPRRKTNTPPPSMRQLDPTQNGMTTSDNCMLTEVPPPPPARPKNRDDYVGPDPPLPEAPSPPNNGYLPMNNMAPLIRTPSIWSANEPEQNYIDPREIDSWPVQELKELPEPFGDLSKCGSSSSENEEYITILPDEFSSEAPVRPAVSRNTKHKSAFDEPLYQIYQIGAVARDIFDQNDCDESLDEDDMELYDDTNVDKQTDKIYETWEALSQTKSVDEIKSTLQSLIRTSTGLRTLWSEMPSVVESEVVSTMTMDERKFQETLFEIITSESSYLRSLKLLRSHFMDSPLFTKDIVSKEDKHILFSNLVAVHDVSERFMKDLEAVWHEDFMLRPTICKVITRYAAADFNVYVSYCTNLTYQERKLRKLRDNNHVFREVLRELEREALCQGLPMQSFITMPMQRITRFPLLIDAVCKRISGYHSVDCKLAETALHTLQKLVQRCNEGARQLQNLEEIADIDKKLNFKNLKKMAIVSQGRSLVKKGQLTHLSKEKSGRFNKKKKEQLYLYLFDDILIITKKKSEEYQVVDYGARTLCHTKGIDEDQMSRTLPHVAPGTSNVFLMTLLENHDKKQADFYFTCENETELTRWMAAVTPAQQVNDDERIYAPWACPQVQSIYRYSAAEPDELSLEEADIVNVTRKMADGWYEGERLHDGKRGWFPANHTMEIQSERARQRNLLQRYRLLVPQAGLDPGGGDIRQRGSIPNTPV